MHQNVSKPFSSKSRKKPTYSIPCCLLLSRSFPVPGPARIKIGCEEWDPWRRPCRNLLGWSKRGTISAMSLTCKRLQLVLRRSQRTTCQTTVGCSAHSVRDFCKNHDVVPGKSRWWLETARDVITSMGSHDREMISNLKTMLYGYTYNVLSCIINDPCIYIHLILSLSQHKINKKKKGAPLQWLGHAWSRMHAWGERHVGILVQHDCKGTSCGKWVQISTMQSDNFCELAAYSNSS